MNTLVGEVNRALNKPKSAIYLLHQLGYLGGLCFDVLAKILRRKFTVSAIRVKKFCSNTMFEAANIRGTDFKAPVSLIDGLRKTVWHEFIDKAQDHVFYTE